MTIKTGDIFQDETGKKIHINKIMEKTVIVSTYEPWHKGELLDCLRDNGYKRIGETRRSEEMKMRVRAYAVDQITDTSHKIGNPFFMEVSCDVDKQNQQIMEKEKELEDLFSGNLRSSKVIQLEKV
jgi:hypothetical protein